MIKNIQRNQVLILQFILTFVIVNAQKNHIIIMKKIRNVEKIVIKIKRRILFYQKMVNVLVINLIAEED